MSLIKSIPPYWKHVLKEGGVSQDDFQDRFELVESGVKLSKLVYHNINTDVTAIHNSVIFWDKHLEELDYDVHHNAFKNVYKVINIPKLRSFQFHLLHNKIFCNNVLFHWGVKKSQGCDWLNVKQSILHLLYECHVVKWIWQELFAIFYRIDDTIVLNKINIVYNLIHAKPAHVLNFLTLVTKFVIFRCKCAGIHPSKSLIISEFIQWYEIEHNIAYNNRKLGKHISKWSPVKSILSQS